MRDVSRLPHFGDEGRDRLSALPDSLILVILSLLPTVQVVRTSVLSKRWKDLWTTIPDLDFSVKKCGAYPNCEDNSSILFVYQVLQLWQGIKIMKFHVDTNCKCSDPHIDSWLDFAMDHGVEELRVCYIDHFRSYRAPLRLFSYSTLRKLSLWYCDVMMTENVQWNRLKYLDIEVLHLEDNVIDKILPGAPQLEGLTLVVWEGYFKSVIHSSSLKQLTIILHMCDYEEANTSLRIWAPNLQTLEIRGGPCCRYQVMNLLSVKDLILDLRCIYECDSSEVIGEMLRRFFPTILCAEKVTLSNLCMEALGALERRYLLSLSSHFKFVRVRSVYEANVADLDNISGELESIVIQHRSLEEEEQQHQVMRGDLKISCSSGDEQVMFLLMEKLLENYSFVYEMIISANPVGRT